MHVLHVTAHLGGGVGKAHAALMAVMPGHIRQTFLLLEEPRDHRYVDEIVAAGAEVVVASGLDDVARRAEEADVVQFEFWNHPRLYECLALAPLPPIRSVMWSHVSGLFEPVIAPGLMGQADRFVFTSPASMVLGEGLPASVRERLLVIGSGFGFGPAQAAPPSVLPDISPSRGEIGWGDPPRSAVNAEFLGSRRGVPISPLEGEMPGRAEGGSPAGHVSVAMSGSYAPVCYLGTVDFIKMNPLFFEVLDQVPALAAVWGACDVAGEVAATAHNMVHPDRIRFMGQTSDPRTALSRSEIFFYPLQPDHYGTAENALIEAMSLGLVPVVLANPAEKAIVQHGVNGLVCSSTADCVGALEQLLTDSDLRQRLGSAAARTAAERYRPELSARQFVALWEELMSHPKRQPDFVGAIGAAPLDWYRSTRKSETATAGPARSKGTFAHFQSCFPEDPCWSDQTA